MADTAETSKRFSISRAALKTAVVYAVFGVLWIRFSDLFLASIIHDADAMTTIQTYKGWFFIVVTASLLFLLVRRNLLELRLFEASLHTSKVQLEGMFRAAGSVAFILSRQRGDTIIVDAVSPGAFMLFGLDSSAVGKAVVDLHLPSALFAPDLPVSGAYAGMTEISFVENNGTQRHLLVNALVLEAGEGSSREEKTLLSVALDVTARKEAETALSSANSFIGSILDGMSSVLIGVDAMLNVTHWNAPAAAASGLDAADVMGRFMPDVFPLLKEHARMISECIRTARTEMFTTRQDSSLIIGHDHSGREGQGTYLARTYEVQIYPLRGVMEGAVVRVDDITERVRLQDMLVQTEKMMSIGGLAAGMAHEINNPLGGILQGVQNIRRRLSPDLAANREAASRVPVELNAIARYLALRGVDHMLDGVFESGRRAADIVANMLEFSRNSDLSHTEVDINALLDKVLGIVDTDYDLEKRYDFKNIVITKEYAPDMPMVLCSRVGIEQVVVNLLRNAAHALAGYDGGEGWVPSFTLRTYARGGSAFIEIADNGPGMTEEQRKRAFEPFYTTKPVGEGTGLGLSVSYYIITTSHKGAFELQTEPGHGALFRIQLPCDGS